MKKQTLAACIIAAIALSMYSCDWFNSSKHYINAKAIIGKWQINSIERDSLSTTEGDPIEGLLFSKPAYNDSLPVTVQFDVDRTYIMYGNNASKIGSNKYYVDSATQKLFVKESSTFSQFTVRVLNDSLMQVSFANEGTKYIMKKQP